jgi:hypothetical protein
MSIRLFNPSGGFIDLNAGGDGTAANVFTLPAETGTLLTTATTSGISASALSTGTLAAARLPAGSVLQVVANTLATGTSTTSLTFVDVGLSANITPSSASSKVLVLVYPSVSNVDTDSNAITFQVLRDSTSITKAVNHLFFTGFTGSTLTRRAALMLSVLDSPNTTSSTTYKLQFHSRLGNSVTTNAANDIATITLMEIAG